MGGCMGGVWGVCCPRVRDSCVRVQELCDSRGGRLGSPVLMNHGHNLSLMCQPTSEDMKLYFIITPVSEFRSCVKVEVAVLGSPS